MRYMQIAHLDHALFPSPLYESHNPIETDEAPCTA